MNSPLSYLNDIEVVSWRALHQTQDTAIALGNFDGVHLGHQKIISELKGQADERGLKPCVLTFHPHPSCYFDPDHPQSLLTTPSEKSERIMAFFGVETLFIEFDEEFSRMEPEDFCKTVLLDKMRAKCVYLGANHCFGKKARGNAELLKNQTKGTDTSVEVIQPIEIEGEVVSSSVIRHLIKEGKVPIANKLLNYRFSYTGKVVAGDGRGKSLGFPTANLVGDPGKILPKNGVYGAEAQFEGRSYPALVNIGETPTFKGNIQKMEAHLLNFDGDIYDKIVTLELNCYLRNEKKFKNADDLVAQIIRDKEVFSQKCTSLKGR